MLMAITTSQVEQVKLSDLTCRFSYWRTFLLLPAVILLFFKRVAGQVPSLEVNALFQLHNSTNGETWLWKNEVRNGLKWNFTLDNSGNFAEDPCSSDWQGITCSGTTLQCSSQTCHIISINLPAYNMSGSIPSEMGNLVNLEVLTLDNNALTGSIPSEVGNLANLEEFSLANNALIGSIPSDVGNLVNLTLLYLVYNSLTGSIPNEVGNLANLVWLYLDSNALIESIPSEVGNLVNLKVLSLYNNALTGSIPSEVCNLLNLKRSYLDNNALTGSIPSEVGNLVNLEVLSVDNNALTGSIPSEVGNLVNLKLLHLYNNALTGSIPSEMGNLVNLVLLYLYNNVLTGSIPTEVGNLVSFEVLSLADNALTGSIPSEVGNLVKLEEFTLANNTLTGSIPIKVGNLINLVLLYLDNNALTGSIPSGVGNLVNLMLFSLDNNALTGSIPSEVANLALLENLLFQNNLFTGGIESIFNASAQKRLEVVDLSDNLLTGHYGDDLFRLPAMMVLALSVNCFDAELPEVMCAASTMEVLSLNGLGAAAGCKNKIRLPISGVSLFNTIGGTLPECVWHMPSLQVLHVVGNELTGELVPLLPHTSRLADLSLSHNKFSGAIPRGIQRVRRVDLSHNQLSGRHNDNEEFCTQGVLSLEINRLSGLLSVSRLANVSELKVLRGNMFSCDTIPKNDDFENDYICGSEDLNDSLFVFGSALLVTGCALMVTLIVSKLGSAEPVVSATSVVAHARRLRKYMLYIIVAPAQAEPQQPIAALCAKLKAVVWLFWVLMMFVVLTCVPIYIVRGVDEDDAYSTHFNTYAWFWTLAYLRGVVPACLVLMSWSATLGVCFYGLVMTPLLGALPAATNKSPLLGLIMEDSPTTTTAAAAAVSDIVSDTGATGATGAGSASGCDGRKGAMESFAMAGALLVNAAVAITVNSFYIYLTQQPLSPTLLLGIQLCLAVFRLVYSSCAIPVLTLSVVDPVANILWRGRLLMVSNLAIPCLVTAFASPSCFQGLILAADAVSTHYSFKECTWFDFTPTSTVCFDWIMTEAQSAPVIPPFIYNNQCSSVLLTSFIPVLIIGCSIQLLSTLLLPVVYYQVGGRVDLAAVFRHKALPGILWPEFWLIEDSNLVKRNKISLENDPTILLDSKNVLCFSVLNNLIIVLTFGLCSPVLAAAVGCVVAVRMNHLLLLLGRFTSVLRADHGDGREEGVHFALEALCRVPFPLTEVLQQSFWLLAWSSALFFALVCWDIACDDVGWVESLWIPAWALCYPGVLWAIGRCVGSRVASTSVLSRSAVCRGLVEELNNSDGGVIVQLTDVSSAVVAAALPLSPSRLAEEPAAGITSARGMGGRNPMHVEVP